jgi:hypothetical protein
MAFALVLLLGLAVERATDGWGLSMQFFRAGLPVMDNPFAQWLVYTAAFLAASSVGMFAGVVFKRWGQLGVWAVSIGTGWCWPVRPS